MRTLYAYMFVFLWLFAYSYMISNILNQIILNRSIWPIYVTKQVRPLRVRVDQKVIAMNRYSALPRSLWVEPHHQMLYSIIPRTLLFVYGEDLILCREFSQGILSFSEHWRLSNCLDERMRGQEKLQKKASDSDNTWIYSIFI